MVNPPARLRIAGIISTMSVSSVNLAVNFAAERSHTLGRFGVITLTDWASSVAFSPTRRWTSAGGSVNPRNVIEADRLILSPYFMTNLFLLESKRPSQLYRKRSGLASFEFFAVRFRYQQMSSRIVDESSGRAVFSILGHFESQDVGRGII